MFGSHSEDAVHQGGVASAIRKLGELNAGPHLTFSFASHSENLFSLKTQLCYVTMFLL